MQEFYFENRYFLRRVLTFDDWDLLDLSNQRVATIKKVGFNHEITIYFKIKDVLFQTVTWFQFVIGVELFFLVVILPIDEFD